MTGIDHRAPGLAVAALLDDAVFVELIADGEHVHPALWPLIARLKPADRLCSSATPSRWPGRATGGRARRSGGRGHRRPGDAGRDDDARRIGHRARHARSATSSRPGIELPAAVAAASRNPLALLGVTDRGRIAVGQRADLVELDADLACRSRHARRDLVHRRPRDRLGPAEARRPRRPWAAFDGMVEIDAVDRSG